jgi:hypothetical protein
MAYSLPDEAENFAADTKAPGGLLRDNTARSRHNGSPKATADPRKLILANILSQARLGNSLESTEDALSLMGVLQIHPKHALPLFIEDKFVVTNIPLLLEEVGNMSLHSARRHIHIALEHHVSVTDSGEHV